MNAVDGVLVRISDRFLPLDKVSCLPSNSESKGFVKSIINFSPK